MWYKMGMGRDITGNLLIELTLIMHFLCPSFFMCLLNLVLIGSWSVESSLKCFFHFCLFGSRQFLNFQDKIHLILKDFKLILNIDIKKGELTIGSGNKMMTI